MEEGINMKEQVWKLGISLALMVLSGLFSGLTLGLLGLDSISLRVISTSGPPKDREYAKKILPLRRHTNLLLCTLLLGNVVVNSLMSILTAEIAGGLMGLIISSAAIVMFGEIIPQATCSRYALLVGALARPVVLFFMVIMFPIAKPISMVLDKALGKDVGQIFDKDELKKLIEYHAKADRKQGISCAEQALVEGAMNFLTTSVGEIMTPINQVFLLDIEETLNEDTLAEVWKRGHSRVPVYEHHEDNIVGILFTKDLVLVSSEDLRTVGDVLRHFNREIERVFEDTPLDQLLKYFKSGRGHLAVVQRVNDERPGDPIYETSGIVTLEDCIERLIQDQVYDETDAQQNQTDWSMASARGNSNMQDRRERTGLIPFNLISRGTADRLTPDHAKAVAGYLIGTTEPFNQGWTQQQASVLLLQAEVNNYIVKALDASTGEEESERAPDKSLLLFEKGKRADKFYMLFSGRVEVKSGADNFECEMGPWKSMGQHAIQMENYLPDFTARVCKTARILTITRDLYLSHANKSLSPIELTIPDASELVTEEDSNGPELSPSCTPHSTLLPTSHPGSDNLQSITAQDNQL